MTGHRLGTATVLHGDALALQLPDESVDLIVTSPPYFGLRSYQDGGKHYEGQLGAEATPTEFLDALIAATAEMVRVLKPSGSIFLNLGDKYNSAASGQQSTLAQWSPENARGGGHKPARATPGRGRAIGTIPTKSLMLIPERYRIRCVDELGLIARAVIVWSKPNGLPESVTDRVRRSHEDWVHLAKMPRYYSAVDEIREEYAPASVERSAYGYIAGHEGGTNGKSNGPLRSTREPGVSNPLGKLPSSVWTVATEPLKLPEHLGVQHFAAFPTKWPRRLIAGWSPREVCTACGEGRRPVSSTVRTFDGQPTGPGQGGIFGDVKRESRNVGVGNWRFGAETTITGYACACPDTTAPATPGVVLDPFGGTGTTATVAKALGRHGITVDKSVDYCRVAEWRTNDERQLIKAAGGKPKPVRKRKPAPTYETGEQLSLEFGDPA